MKSIIAYIIIVAMLISCKGTHKPQPITSVKLLIDQTGDLQAVPKAEQIHKLYDLRRRTERGGSFTVKTITDLEYSPSVTFAIEPQALLMQNPGLRKKGINDFEAKITLTLAQVSLQPVGKSRSQIYAPIIQSLHEISKEDVDEKIVLVTSDLAENSIFSMYKPADMRLLLDSPDAVATRLGTYGTLGDMTGVTVQFSFTAPDYESSQRHSLMASWYKRQIEAKGGKVFISGGSLLN